MNVTVENRETEFPIAEEVEKLVLQEVSSEDDLEDDDEIEDDVVQLEYFRMIENPAIKHLRIFQGAPHQFGIVDGAWRIRETHGTCLV